MNYLLIFFRLHYLSGNSPFNFRSSSVGYNLRLIFIGFFLSLIFRVNISTPILYYIVLIIALSVYFSVFILPKKLLIYPLLLIILTMPDLTQSSDELDALGLIESANLWQFSVGYFTPAVLIFFMLLVVMIRLVPIPKPFPYKLVLFYFLIITPLVSIYNGFLVNSPSRFFSDFKIVTFFCVGLIIFHSYFRQFNENLLKIIISFFFLALGTFLLDFFKFLFISENQSVQQSYYNLSMDSAKGLITIFLFFSLLNLTEGKKIFFNIFIILIVIVLLISYQTRWLIVTLLLGILLLLSFRGIINFFKIVLVIVFLFLLIVPILNQLNPEPWKVMLLRFGFVESLASNSDITDVELARGSAIINSVSTIADNKAWLTGLGYGSWYSDIYFPMSNLTTAAFDEESLRTGKYYRVHDFVFHFIFKFGLIGLFTYSALFFGTLRDIWRRKSFLFIDANARKLFLAYIGIMPMTLTFMFTTGKGLLFSALYIVTLKCLLDFYSESSTITKNLFCGK